MCSTTCPTRHPLLCIVPPYVLAHVSRLRDPRFRKLAENALRTLSLSERFRGERGAIGGIAPLVAAPSPGKERIIYDGGHTTRLPGKVVRKEGGAATADVSVNEAYEGLGGTYDLYAKAYRRDSIDGRGMPLYATVHYGRSFNNAFWNGRQMVFGDGDGKLFQRFTRSIDVIGHELTHGVTQYEAGLEYQGQPGALNESISDVFGSLVKQFTLKQKADQADWLIGAGLWARGIKGVALRSMKDPGSAYNDPRIGRDPQPGNMKDYVDTDDDNGGVHINSGIPNRAFYLAAIGFGGSAWRKAGAVWYKALTDLLKQASDFADAARVTTDVAGREFGKHGADIVRAAWTEVGVVVRARAGGRKHARRARTKRRVRRPTHRKRR
jgi:Zn-dependent metalloprotease